MVEQSKWMAHAAGNPGHSQWYVQRFRDMAARGEDIVGEARFVDAMLSRGSRVLDAGCGAGRNAGHLHTAGHQVTGVDIDPVLIDAARADHPGPDYRVMDLAELRLPDRFDAILCAGNVMTFLAESTRVAVLRGFRDHLAEGGRVAIGFGAGRDYPFTDFFDDAASAGLRPLVTLGGWHVEQFTEDSDFLVAILAAATTAPE